MDFWLTAFWFSISPSLPAWSWGTFFLTCYFLDMLWTSVWGWGKRVSHLLLSNMCWTLLSGFSEWLPLCPRHCSLTLTGLFLFALDWGCRPLFACPLMSSMVPISLIWTCLILLCYFTFLNPSISTGLGSKPFASIISLRHPFCPLFLLLTCWLYSSSSWWCLSIIFLLCHRQPADHLLLIDQLYAFTSLRCLTWWLIIFATCNPWYSSLSLPLFESPPYLFLR